MLCLPVRVSLLIFPNTFIAIRLVLVILITVHMTTIIIAIVASVVVFILIIKREGRTRGHLHEQIMFVILVCI